MDFEDRNDDWLNLEVCQGSTPSNLLGDALSRLWESLSPDGGARERLFRFTCTR